jgi:hypothetical protein
MSDRHTATVGADRFLLGIVAGAILLVVVSIVVVFQAGRGSRQAVVDPDSPSGVVHSYVEAIRAGQVDRAYGFLSRSAQTTVPLDTFRQRFSRRADYPDSTSRVLIQLTSSNAEAAEVKVTTSQFSAQSDPFSTSTYHRDTTIHLVREDGAWRIDRPAGPFL